MTMIRNKSWKNSWVLALVVIVLLGESSRAQGQTSAPLTLQQVIDIAKTKNPTLLAAEQNLLSVKGQEIQAGVRANPTLTVLGNNVTLPIAGTPNPYAYTAQVSRLFERGDKRRWRLEGARSTTDQTAAQYHDQQRQTILTVKQAFTSMLLAKGALRLAEDNLRDYKRELDINRDRYKAGGISKLDFERLDLQLAQFENDEANARMSLMQASYQLQTLTGISKPNDKFDIAGDLVPAPLFESLTDLEQKALASRPDYQAAEAAVRVAAANIKLTYANGLADPTLEGEYDRSANFNSFGFYISVPIRIFDRNQGNIETSKYQARSSQFAETAARNQVLSDVDQAWVGYTTAKSLSDRYRGHYLDEGRDVLSIAQFSYEHGGLALIDYLNALQDNRSTSLDALNAYAQTWMAIHQLSFVTATEIVP